MAFVVAASLAAASPGASSTAAARPLRSEAAGAPTPPKGADDAKAEAADVKPIDTPGIDPVLDEVPVEETAATRRADARFNERVAIQGHAALQWLSADRKRVQLVTRSIGADAAIRAAERTLAAAKATEAHQLDVLGRRRATERTARAALAVQQDELRRLAAAVVASVPSDEFSFLGDHGDYSAGDRRQVVRERSIDQQSGRVDAARRPWARAHRIRQAQDRRVARARTARRKDVRDLTEKVHIRDDYGHLLAVAEADARDRLHDLDGAKADTHDAATGRREARLTSGVLGTDFPLVALDAYWRASGAAPCVVPWWVLAGVGRVESRHGTAQGAELTTDGTTTRHILGIALDGRPGTFAVHDTDGGRLDDDAAWDRAVGPMQFLPGTWGRWATDDNADGVKDPHNLYDAAGAAAAYLCFGHGDLTTEPAIRAGLFAYNRSVPYANQVLAAGHDYQATLDLPDEPPPPTALDATTTGG